MRISLAGSVLIMLGVLCLAGTQNGDTCTVTVKLVYAATGAELAGLLRLEESDGTLVRPAGLLSRGLGLDEKLPIGAWSVVPKGTVVQLPQKRLRVTAIAGLEREAATREIDLTGRAEFALTVPLTQFYQARAKGWRSGNTHIHLMKVSREDCDRYLREVPQADDLDAAFVSYLERAVADREYTTNRYTADDLATLQKQSGVVFGNGEEHRHNFAGFGQGYGHVMLLDIRQLIQPVSIGPGITLEGTDGLPLQRGIDAARRDEATIIWCHNKWGTEMIPNLITGRIDAQNIFDGGVHGSYKDSYYRSLNAGLQTPFSTGTDWFIYDLSRVYVDLERELTVDAWLSGLKAGRCYITNGPLLEFRVNDQKPGARIAAGRGDAISVVARGLGRIDFERLELVRNGQVVAKSATKPVGGHFESILNFDIMATEPAWFALRTPPPPVAGDPELQAPVPLNEFGKELFAHTSAIFLDVGGRRYFDARVAGELLAEMRANMEMIAEQGKFADDQEKARVLDVYRDGMAAMEKWIARHAP